MAAKTLSPWAQDAASVRRAIAEARRTGALGDLPKDVKIRVTCDSFSGGSSITMTVVTDGGPWGWTPPTGRDEFPHPSTAARELGDKLADIFREHRTVGYAWGDVSLDHAANLASVPRKGWRPGED